MWIRESPSQSVTFELTYRDNSVTASGRVFTYQGLFLLRQQVFILSQDIST